MSVDVTNATKSDQNRPSRDSVHQGPDAQTLAFAAALLIEDTHTDEEIALRVHELLEDRPFKGEHHPPKIATCCIAAGIHGAVFGGGVTDDTKSGRSGARDSNHAA